MKAGGLEKKKKKKRKNNSRAGFMRNGIGSVKELAKNVMEKSLPM